MSMRFVLIDLEADKGRLVGFSAATKRGAKGTIVKIEVDVVDEYALASLMRELAEAKKPPQRKAPAAPERPAPPAPRKALPAPLLALPAPRGRTDG